MFRITIYKPNGKEVLDETPDPDEMFSYVKDCISDLKKNYISGFTVSRISGGLRKKGFWEK